MGPDPVLRCTFDGESQRDIPILVWDEVGRQRDPVYITETCFFQNLCKK